MQLRKLAIGLVLAIATIVVEQSSVLSLEGTQNFTPTRLSQASQSQSTRFKVRIENISTKDQFTASNGTKWTLDFAPGFWLIHNNNDPIFMTGQKDRGQGLEALAEDGNPNMLAKSLQNQRGMRSSGVFDKAVGSQKVGGILPGQMFEFTIRAQPGAKLSLFTMFGQSNDWFYAPDGNGIALFDDNGKPISGDVTSKIMLWNGGTEVDQEPGIGSEQGPRQKAPNTGANEMGVLQLLNSQADYAQTSKLMRVTITPER